MNAKIDQSLYVVIDKPSSKRVRVYTEKDAAEAHAYGFTNLTVIEYELTSAPLLQPQPLTREAELGWGEHPDNPVEGADDHDVAVEQIVDKMSD